LRRHLAGIIALTAALVGAALWHWPITGFPDMAGPCFRVATLFAIVWLAFDEVQRLPAWLVVAFPIFLIVLVIRPRWALMLLPVLIVLAILTPKWSKRR
jgi:hypothetical protein